MFFCLIIVEELVVWGIMAVVMFLEFLKLSEIIFIECSEWSEFDDFIVEFELLRLVKYFDFLFKVFDIRINFLRYWFVLFVFFMFSVWLVWRDILYMVFFVVEMLLLVEIFLSLFFFREGVVIFNFIWVFFL